MAVDLHNTDQSLLSSSSSGFFTQEHETFFSLNKLIETNNSSDNTWSSCFGTSDSGSVLSSPVESEVGSTETESDPEEEEQDDYLAELSRQMAHYMLQDDEKHEKSWGLTRSPQSTLRSSSPFGSNHESPKGPSREPSPPPTMIEELEKMKINNLFCNHQNIEFQSKQALIDDQIRAIQFFKLKQEQAMKQLDNKKQFKQHHQNKSKAFGDGSNNNVQKTNRPPSSTTSISYQSQAQTHQQQPGPGPGMRAVLLGGSASSRAGSCGTGVFLPRGIGYSPDQSRKKPGCATVLIPARVVQALKQHFDKVGVGGFPSGFNGRSTFPLQHDANVAGERKNSLYKQQQQQSQSMNKQEIGLPQEWTY
ncbi:hypothetical protein LWI29_034863 [Acer saccharum]|uniref:Uncharacterized protein n=1 Tax=Acer saccharum TaxID=4024 RepID=A0AA39W7P2_ACESA|nr:hypothetical protein LWI29_034863 [Acer saccharum]